MNNYKKAMNLLGVSLLALSLTVSPVLAATLSSPSAPTATTSTTIMTDGSSYSVSSFSPSYLSALQKTAPATSTTPDKGPCGGNDICAGKTGAACDSYVKAQSCTGNAGHTYCGTYTAKDGSTMVVSKICPAKAVATLQTLSQILQ